MDEHGNPEAGKPGIDRRIAAVVIAATLLVALGFAYHVFMGPSDRARDESNVFKRPTMERAAPGRSPQPFNPLYKGK